MSVRLEVCVDSPEGLAAAIAGGADRIELCAALDLGGLTPPAGLMALAAKAPIPVYAMIRPRAGNFVYDGDNEAAMLADVDAARTAGLAGVVIGASCADGTLDLPLLTRLSERAKDMGVTLHRAFDLVPDPIQALEQAIELGVERVLTSGLQVKALDGLGTLKVLADLAADRLSIMPGSGINIFNVERIVSETGVHEVHSSCRVPLEAVDQKAVNFGFQPSASYQTNSVTVLQMRNLLDMIGNKG
ncbi:copper homeostasis protein CutC [Rhizobium deserti]|uniref:PF03932 family protein CutC n=1 Tax=Rhizobium deserti TaxID=2547961 RepID=A0A4R5UM58_9HYPH|nr:copper homeostasis protein CutC [Rhizobium deserti]TDK38921.1 copper homeostasis protein CutC [Rhizobium deserti]